VAAHEGGVDGGGVDGGGGGGDDGVAATAALTAAWADCARQKKTVRAVKTRVP
jgi:hypothetical protein